MKIKVINKSSHSLPSYATEYAAGVDLRADLKEAVVVGPMEKVLIPSGIYLEIPPGFEVQIRPRSGLALKHGITILNTPGTIDADYRGEVKVLLVNLSPESFEIRSGDRIAQAVFSRFERIEWDEVTELSDTNRGAGSYGHTGLK